MRLLKILVWLAAGAVAVVGVAIIVVYRVSDRRLERTYRVESPHVVTYDDSLTLARGRHVAEIQGCVQCHAPSLAGRVVIDARPLLGRIVSANLTSGRNGVAALYRSDADWVRAIRDGVRPDSTPVVFMPSYQYRTIGPEDLGALVSYLKAAPPADSPPLEQDIGIMARVLYLFGRFPLIPAEMIDHSDQAFAEPPQGATVEYGRYLAGPCARCHGEDYSGGRVPGAPADWPGATNLTPDSATGLGSWTEEQFMSFFADGRGPDGRRVDERSMPWSMGKAMTDAEKRALWAFLRSLNALPTGMHVGTPGVGR
jgi:mono/diheme cytochrome c family protein